MDKIKNFIRGAGSALVIMPHEAYEDEEYSLYNNWEAVGQYMYYAIGQENKNIEYKKSIIQKHDDK
jgi:hypothetical protein